MEEYWLEFHFYRPQRSWAKVIFSQACVKNSVHGEGEGVCLSACWDTPPQDQAHPPGPGTHTPRDQAHTPPGTRHTHPLGPGTHPHDQAPPGPGTHTPWDQAHPPRTRHTPPGPGTHPSPGPGTLAPRSRLQHTVNERPVRILLECILVLRILILR